MSYDTKQDTITVNNDGVSVTYDVEREPDRGHPEETLTLRVFDVETDEFIDPFPGLSGTLGMEEFDQEAHNPRDWSNVGTMAVSYSGYNLGDEDIEKIDFEVKCPHCDGENEDPNGNWVVGIHHTAERLAVGSQEECEIFLRGLPAVASGRYYIEPLGCPNCVDGYVEMNPVDYFRKERGARVVIGLTVYEHSGITMRAGNVTLPWDTDRWDTSFVGFIYDTPEKVKECMGDDATDQQIEACLRSEVAVYAAYLEGDITNYTVEDEETNFFEGCGGYVGDHEQCEDECFAALEAAIVKRLAEQKERAEWAARDTITK